MTSIETLIGNLLLRHNCVIVPSFGGFVAKQLSAKIDYESGRMSPPSKSLLFNKNLINNDGLLINEFAAVNGVSFDNAQVDVQNKVAEWNKTIKEGGRIELDRVGFIFLDEEKNMCFEQDRFFNLLLQSFGLGSVHFLSDEDVKIVEREQHVKHVENLKASQQTVVEQTSIIEIKTEEKPQQVKGLQISSEHPAIAKQRSSVWKYVAAACFLPIAFYSIWIPMKTDVLESGVISINDFNPFKKPAKSEYSPVKSNLEQVVLSSNKEHLKNKVEEISSDVSVYTYKFDESYFVPVKINESNVSEESTPQQKQDNLNDVDVQTVNYIVGCFSDKNNAQNLVLKLKEAGLSARIVDFHNGLHRVSAGGAMTSEGLEDIKTSTTSMGLSGWILK